MTIGYRYSQLNAGPTVSMKPEHPAKRRVRPWYLRARLKPGYWRRAREERAGAGIAVPSQTSQREEDNLTESVDSTTSDAASLLLKSAQTDTGERESLPHSAHEANSQPDDERIKMKDVEAHECYPAWLRLLHPPPLPYSKLQDTGSSMKLEVMKNRNHSFRDFKPLAIPAVRPEHIQMELSTSAEHRLPSTGRSASDGRTIPLFPNGDYMGSVGNTKSAFDSDSESTSDDGSLRSSLSQRVYSDAESLGSFPVLKNGFNRLRKASMSSLRSICRQFSDGSYSVSGTGGEVKEEKRAS
jgi:hypothetical protein